eukprot:317336-Chlamydomonas_euryale.AAC.3
MERRSRWTRCGARWAACTEPRTLGRRALWPARWSGVHFGPHAGAACTLARALGGALWAPARAERCALRASVSFPSGRGMEHVCNRIRPGPNQIHPGPN